MTLYTFLVSVYCQSTKKVAVSPPALPRGSLANDLIWPKVFSQGTLQFFLSMLHIQNIGRFKTYVRRLVMAQGTSFDLWLVFSLQV